MTETTTLTHTCASCEIEITDRPVVHLGLAFCCAGCAAGGPCTCSYDGDEPAAGGEVRHCLDVRAVLGSDGPGSSQG